MNIQMLSFSTVLTFTKGIGIKKVSRISPSFWKPLDRSKTASFKLPDRQCSTKNELKSQDVQHMLDNAAVFNNEDDTNNLWSTSPYPKGVYNPRLQSNYALRPKTDPRETSIILFPGEGSQYVGMGHGLLKFPGVKDIFSAANDIVKYDVLSLCLQGPKSKLDETKYAQVAIIVSSFAALERLREERPTSVENCIVTAGFGIGELTALTFAGAITFERAVRLAHLRGEAMELACKMESSGMLMVLYKPETRFHELLLRAKEYAANEGIENPVCEVANYLFPHCKVVAGHNKCLDYIQKHYKALHIGKVKHLPMEGAYYTKLMEPAAYTFKEYLMKSDLQEPIIDVHSSVDGKQYRDKKDILNKLPKQMVKPMRWEQMMHIIYKRPVGQHFPITIECGPGNTLKSILKMVNAKAYDRCETVFD